MASNLKAKSVSIPAISSGIYDFPVEHCAKIFYGTLVEYLDAHSKTNTLQVIRVVLHDQHRGDVFLKELQESKVKLSEMGKEVQC